MTKKDIFFKTITINSYDLFVLTYEGKVKYQVKWSLPIGPIVQFVTKEEFDYLLKEKENEI